MAAPARSSSPDAEHSPPCGLPAVGAFTAYRRDPAGAGGLTSLQAFPFCRFHEQTQRAAANQVAEAVPEGTYYGAYPTEYTAGQSRVACTGDRNPVQLGDALDRERIVQAADAARAALRQLTALTTNAYGHVFEVGNEGAVLEALLELAADVEEEAGVVARRLSSRHPARWFRVAEAALGIRPDDSPAVRHSAALSLWHRWGGGLDDDVPPTLEDAGDGTTTS